MSRIPTPGDVHRRIRQTITALERLDLAYEAAHDEAYALNATDPAEGYQRPVGTHSDPVADRIDDERTDYARRLRNASNALDSARWSVERAVHAELFGWHRLQPQPGTADTHPEAITNRELWDALAQQQKRRGA